MNYLSVENYSKNYGEKQLFENISFGLDQGQKIALVAKNGSGKTSLLNCLTGKDTPDTGSCVYRKDIMVGYLEQEQNFDPNKTIIDIVFETDNKVLTLIKEYEIALNTPGKENEMQDLFEQISELDAWSTENKIQEILSKLKLDNLQQKIEKLSGGQKRRLALAKILIEEPDVLILDEPTNHLDLEMIEWLEGFLTAKNLTLFMVTHDRYFLERVCDEILELEGGNLYRYKGNYSYFLEKRAERHQSAQTTIDKAKNLFTKELEWMRRQPKARGTKAKSRISDFHETKEIAHQKIDEKKVEINVKMERMGSKILELHKVSKAYGEKIILDKFEYIFKKKERVGLVGANGAGKSTFLNIITEKEPVDSGKIVVGDTIVYGYYTQSGLQLKEDKRVIEVIRDIAEYLPIGGGKKLTASGLLERFLFPTNMHFQYVSKLSGGERKRLYLLTILMKNPNFLILDEPTNDLDIFTLQVLEDYLLSFEGCLVVVSHDRYFMDKIVDHMFVLNGDGSVKDITGNYSEYRIFKKDRDIEERKAIREETIIAKEQRQEEKRKLTYKEKLEFEKLEIDIEEMESRKKELSEKLNNPTLEYDKIEEISNEISSVVSELDLKTERWLELSEFI